jgi:hypothetical protein
MGKEFKLPRRRRLLLPILLLLIGVATLAGCIYIPLPKSPVDSKQVDPTAVLGERNSNAPLAIGKVSKLAVVQVLGPPLREASDGRTIGYVIRRKGGLWISLFCAYHAETDLAVRLEFDASGFLAHYEYLEQDAMQYLFPGSYIRVMTHDIEVFMDRIGPGNRDLPAVNNSSARPAPASDGSRYETVPGR